jgi:delta 1-pyrroline-5-carboxylate dehydrogenase
VAAQGEIVQDAPSGGWYVRPTLVAGVPDRHALAQEEIFGPVQVVIAFDGEAQALRIGQRHGLVAGVWTRDGGRQLRMARALKCGQVFVNNYGAGGGVELPFGGVVGPRPREGLRGALRLLGAEDGGHPARLSRRSEAPVKLRSAGGSHSGRRWPASQGRSSGLIPRSQPTHP